jgi:hypothetical protein
MSCTGLSLTIINVGLTLGTAKSSVTFACIPVRSIDTNTLIIATFVDALINILLAVNSRKPSITMASVLGTAIEAGTLATTDTAVAFIHVYFTVSSGVAHVAITHVIVHKIFTTSTSITSNT